MRETLQRGWHRIRTTLHALAHSRPALLVRAYPIRIAMIGCLVTGIGATAWATSCGLRGCPSEAELRAFRPSEGGRVLDRRGRTLGYLHPVRRITVPLNRIPKSVQQAFVAVEDRRFLEHDGLDWHGAARAFLVNLRHFALRQGSSTITMQAARSAFLDRYEGQRSIRRKLIELHLAGRLEAALTKPQILELYLNTIYLGDGTYGVEAASRHYFGKSVQRLSLEEAALLAGLPRAPSYYDPRRNSARAKARRDLVLGLMADQQFITPAASQRARGRQVVVARHGWRPDGGPSDALDLVRASVDSLLGEDAWRTDELIVQTTFDLDAQRAAERAVRDRAAAISRGQRRGSAPVQGAMAAIDPQNGEVRAIVGSAVTTPGGFNRAITALRQPGSAFKPFVYAAALEQGYRPYTLVQDEPVQVTQQGRTWEPANYGNVYRGTVPLQDALTYSLNAATVRVSQDVGMARVVDLARRAGITSPIKPLPSLALGSAEVAPLELVRAYAPFGNGGWRVTPSHLVSITARGGAVRWQRSEPMRTRALDPRDAFVLTTMLQSVVDEGTGASLRRYGVTVPAAGKTGTSNDGADVWFVGYTRTLVAGFWFGFDTPHSLGSGATGGRLAAPAWVSFYRRGWSTTEDAQGWDVPDGVERRGGRTSCGFLGFGTCRTTPEYWVREGAEAIELPPDDDQTAEQWDGETGLQQVLEQLAQGDEARRIQNRVQAEIQRAMLEVQRAARQAERQAARDARDARRNGRRRPLE